MAALLVEGNIALSVLMLSYNTGKLTLSDLRALNANLSEEFFQFLVRLHVMEQLPEQINRNNVYRITELGADFVRKYLALEALSQEYASH